MDVALNRENEKLVIKIDGRIDTITAPELDKKIFESIGGVKELVLDLKDMPYTSSAGLRVLLKAQKAMQENGKMKLINVSDDVMEVFDMTGFSDILTIE